MNWASIKKCIWLQHEKSKNRLLKAIKSETILPTPLNIKDFVMASRNVIEEEELLVILRKRSQKTPYRFAKDIDEMIKQGEREKILFLCFPFISDWFSIDFVKTEYNKLLTIFHIKDDYGLSFGRARKALEDKIEVTAIYNTKRIRFSHPSYAEALPFLLLEDDIPTKINTKFFSKVLITLADNKDAASDVAHAIDRNFDKLPENVQNLLFKLADNKNTASDVVYAIAQNFDKLPENVRNEVLIKLADNKDAARDVISTVVDNFDKLPENIRNELLLKAIKCFEEVIRIKHDDADAWYNKGYALFNLARYEDAIKSYEEAIRIKPDDADAWYNLASSNVRKGDIGKGLSNLKKAIEVGGDTYIKYAREDHDFNSIRNIESFKGLIKNTGTV